MKKTYELPKAEKVVFDYSDVVVASDSPCIEIYNGTINPSGGNCKEGWKIEYTNQA